MTARISLHAPPGAPATASHPPTLAPPLLRASLALGLLLGGAGCASSTDVWTPGGGADASGGRGSEAGADVSVGQLSVCSGPGVHPWDPAGDGPPAVFPDDVYTVADPSSVTGLRVRIDSEVMPWFASQDPSVQLSWSGLDGLEGFGVVAPLTVELSPLPSTVPSGEQASLASDTMQLWDLGLGPDGTPNGTASRVPYTAEWGGEGTMLVWPMVPLRPSTVHGLLVTRALQPFGGGCYRPSGPLIEELEAAARVRAGATGESRRATLTAALLDAAEVPTDAASVASVFTTQDAVGEAAAVASVIRQDTEHFWGDERACAINEHGQRRCDMTFRSRDHRGPNSGKLVAAAAPPWDVSVSAWFPDEAVAGPGPYPVVVIGHGITATRLQADPLAQQLMDLPFILVSADAMKHGDHPTSSGGDEIEQTVDFLGLDIQTVEVDGRSVRDAFRQTTFDRLHLIETLRLDPDLDGDGVADAAPERMMYLGFSLGGIMGTSLLALSDAFELGVMFMPGARITSMLTHSADLGFVLQLISSVTGNGQDAWRLIAAVQAIVEAGDPAPYARHVLHDRLPGTGDAPHVVALEALDDGVVPNITTRILARAMGLPVLGDALDPIEGVPHLPDLPQRDNLVLDGGGVRTGGVLQLDRITNVETGELELTQHATLPRSEEGLAVIRHVLETWREDGSPEIIDAYEAVGTPPLPPGLK